MTPQPPPLAVWLLSLFLSRQDPIFGDLFEEFQQKASAASRWYWRQTLKTIPGLLALQFRSAPGRIALGVVTALALEYLECRAMRAGVSAILNHVPVYHFMSAYSFWLLYSVAINRVLVPLFVGWLLARMSRRSEMAAALTFGIIIFATMMTWTATFLLFHDPPPFLWMAVIQTDLFNLGFPLGVMAGTIMRRRQIA